jgi:TorA maturation chaperone TorD
MSACSFKKETLEVRRAYLKLLKGNGEAFRQALQDQKRFLNDHLLKWAPDLSEKITEHAETGFYRGASMILKGFLPLDLEAHDEMLEQPNLFDW